MTALRSQAGDLPSFPPTRPPDVSEVSGRQTAEVTVTDIDVPFRSIFWLVLKVQAAGLIVSVILAPALLLLLLVCRGLLQFMAR